MSTDREELKRRIKERLGEGKPKTKRKTRVKLAAKIAAICACFAVALIVALAGFRLIPGYEVIPALLSIGAPLGIAWLVTAGVGQNLVPGKHALVLATICLLVAAPLVYFKPWERGGGWQPGGGEVPENIPEGYTAFRFVSSFTYVSSPTNETITDVKLELPWPYINDSPGTGKPVGLDNFVYLENLEVGGWYAPEAIYDYLKELFNLKSGENIRENVWEVPGWDVGYKLTENGPVFPSYLDVDFRPTLSLYYGNQLEWRDNQTITLLGKRTTEPRIRAFFWGNSIAEKFTKVIVDLSDLCPGETVAIEGTFLVHEENAQKVRLDDYIWCTVDRLWTKPTQENAPMVMWRFSPDITIAERFLSKLEKQIGTDFVAVDGQQFGRISTVGYIDSIGYGFLTTLQ